MLVKQSIASSTFLSTSSKLIAGLYFYTIYAYIEYEDIMIRVIPISSLKYFIFFVIIRIRK